MSPETPQRPVGFKPQEISALFNKEVITQHVEDAAFLWLQRDQAVGAPNYSCKDLADLDERVEANLDGLRIAGKFGWKLCEEALGQEEPGEVFAAGVLALGSRDIERIQKVLDIGCSDPELERALISALGWLSFDQVENVIKDLLLSEQSEIRRVGIAAFAVHRMDPGPLLSKAISDPDVRLRTRALKAAGELGKIALLPLILKSISDTNDECRFYAAWSAARLGQRTSPVIAVLQEITESPGMYAERALDIALRCMELQHAKAWRQKLRDSPSQLRLAAIGAGVIGDPALLDDLVALMEIDDVARVAGEAFSMITGVDIEYEDLDTESSESSVDEEPESESDEDAEMDLNEDMEVEADEDIGMDADEDLPWPAPNLINKWLKDNKKNFQAGKRYLMGKEINKNSLHDTLKQGNQRQRVAAALELGLMEPNQPLFEVRAPGKRQIKLMESWTS